MTPWQKLRDRLTRLFRKGGPEGGLLWHRWLQGYVRILYAVVQRLASGDLSLHAMSLVYTTLLSLVPLLAFSFSVLKGFGVHNQLEPFLGTLLDPLGAEGQEISRRLTQFVDNMSVGVLGSLGLAMLIYTVISLMMKVEAALNRIWYVTEPRRLAERASGYLSVLLIGPVLVFSALGLSASLMSSALVQELSGIAPVAVLIEGLGHLVPYLFVIGAFTLVYILIPNTPVRLRSALVGAVVAGALWETTGWAFARFVMTSTNYAAIYSSFAIAILFMIWLYLCWLILLVGAAIAFYHQRPEYIGAQHGRMTLSDRMHERVALLAMYRVGRAYLQGEGDTTSQGLAEGLRVPLLALVPILESLEEKGLLLRTRNDPARYVPGKDPESIAISEILFTVKQAGEPKRPMAAQAVSEPAVDEVVAALERTLASSLGTRSLKELLAAPTSSEHPDSAA